MPFPACKLSYTWPYLFRHGTTPLSTQSTRHPLPLPLALKSLHTSFGLFCFPFVLFFQPAQLSVFSNTQLHLIFHTHACCIISRLVPRTPFAANRSCAIAHTFLADASFVHRYLLARFYSAAVIGILYLSTCGSRPSSWPFCSVCLIETVIPRGDTFSTLRPFPNCDTDGLDRASKPGMGSCQSRPPQGTNCSWRRPGFCVRFSLPTRSYHYAYIILSWTSGKANCRVVSSCSRLLFRVDMLSKTVMLTPECASGYMRASRSSLICWRWLVSDWVFISRFTQPHRHVCTTIKYSLMLRS